MLPNGTVTTGTSVSYTATENGTLTFYGLTRGGNVLAIQSYVVANIDREEKDVLIVPGDEKWRNEDIEVKINVAD